MTPSPSRLFFALAACVFGACIGTALPAQPARVPASTLEVPASPFAGHPYKSALGAVRNYQSCGVRARGSAAIEIDNALRSIEAAATAKGLGPTLERLRTQYQQLLAVSTMTACGGGPRAALAGARRALRDFRAWVADQPGGP